MINNIYGLNAFYLLAGIFLGIFLYAMNGIPAKEFEITDRTKPIGKAITAIFAFIAFMVFLLLGILYY